MKKILDFILERGKEKSTILTILTGIAGFISYSISPELSEAIAIAVASVISAIAIATKEEK